MKTIYTSDDYVDGERGWIYKDGVFEAFSNVEDNHGLAFQAEYNANFLNERHVIFYIDNFGTYADSFKKTAEVIAKTLINVEREKAIESLLDEAGQKIMQRVKDWLKG